ncbi:MAG: MFS transporter [Rhizobiales bacterium]|nr:MFS transporter [Hyphomicrobiales bacterium]
MSSDPQPLWPAVTALGATQIIGWGTTFYALGALSPDIAADRAWPATLIFGAFSAALLLSGAISRKAGRAIDVHGGRRVMGSGSLLAAAGCAILGLATAEWIYVAGWLVLGVAMRFILYDAAFPSLAQIAGLRARRAISYLSLFGGLASTVFWPVSHYLAEAIGWRGTFWVYAGLHLFICLPLHLLFLRGPPKPEQHADTSSDGLTALRPLIGRERVHAMAAFAAVVALNGLVFSAISAHIVPLFQGLGFAPAIAVTLAALVGPCQVVSRIGDILLGHRISVMQLGLIAVGLLPVALIVFIGGGFALTAGLFFAALYGMSNGLMTIAKGAVPLSLFGRQDYGLVIGTIVTPQLILNAVAPTLFVFILAGLGPEWSLGLCLIFGSLSLLAMIHLARLHPR